MKRELFWISVTTQRQPLLQIVTALLMVTEDYALQRTYRSRHNRAGISNSMEVFTELLKPQNQKPEILAQPRKGRDFGQDYDAWGCFRYWVAL